MKTQLLFTSVAAVALMTAGIASAQQPQAERPPAAQQGAPAEKMAPSMKAGERKAPETSGQATREKAAPDMKAGNDAAKPSETTGQSPKAAETEKSGGAMKSDTGKMNDNKAGDSKAKTEMNRSDSKSDMKASDSKADAAKPGASKAASDASKPDANKADASKADASKPSATTGQGAAAGSAKLSTEQRTKITTVIRSQKVERVEPSKLNISIRIGERVPTSVRYHRVPTEVVTIYPEWRGYDYILVGETIVILDPRTHEIVFILEA